VDEVVWGCLSNGCSDDKEIYGLPVGDMKRVNCTLSWIKMFPSPFNVFYLFILFIFLSRE
jgi:hypothetical protein